MPIEIVRLNPSSHETGGHGHHEHAEREKEKKFNEVRGAYLISHNEMKELFSLKLYRTSTISNADSVAEVKKTVLVGQDLFGHLLGGTKEDEDASAKKSEMRAAAAAVSASTEAVAGRDLSTLHKLHVACSGIKEPRKEEKILMDQLKRSMQRVQEVKTGTSMIHTALKPKSIIETLEFMVAFARQSSSTLLAEIFAVQAELDDWRQKK
jgi:hypothetical protein